MVPRLAASRTTRVLRASRSRLVKVATTNASVALRPAKSDLVET
jgi:hypothetical protein